MAENQNKSNGTKKNAEESTELWQEITTPLTHEMIYAAVIAKHPDLFTGQELVKFEGGATPTVKTRRRVSK